MLTARRIPALDPSTGNEGPERRVCAVCGFIQWGNSKPTASAIVVDASGRVLLARRAIEPFKGQWDVPGGFLEAGEAPEAGAVREIREETGLEVVVVRLIGVYLDTYPTPQMQRFFEGQPVPFEDTLNFYYECRIVDGVAQAEDDIDALAWFALEEVPHPLAFDNAERALADHQRHVAGDTPTH